MTDISVLDITWHAKRRYAERIMHIMRPSANQIRQAGNRLKGEMRKAERVQADHVDIGEPQEAYKLESCVVYVRQGAHVTTVVSHSAYRSVLKKARGE